MQGVGWTQFGTANALARRYVSYIAKYNHFVSYLNKNKRNGVMRRTIAGGGRRCSRGHRTIVAASERGTRVPVGVQEAIQSLAGGTSRHLQEDRVLNVDVEDPSMGMMSLLLERTSFQDIVQCLPEPKAPEYGEAKPSKAVAATGGRENVLGNDLEPRVWYGDLCDIPTYMGPFAWIIVSADRLGKEVKGMLASASLMLQPGGTLLLWRSDTVGVMHALGGKLEPLIDNLCLQAVPVEGLDPNDGIVLKVPANFELVSGPRFLHGTVVEGYGRGSKDLGVPTANLSPDDVQDDICGLPDGVYFGWAGLENEDNLHKMVMNIGKRPTFVDDNSPEMSIEVHVMHKYDSDFYGSRMHAVLLGYLRPEMKFSGLRELLHRIHTDIGMAKAQLEVDKWQKYKVRGSMISRDGLEE